MSQTIIAVFTILAAQVLPHFGIIIGNDTLTAFISTGITIVSGLWIWVRRYQQGDVKLFGGLK